MQALNSIELFLIWVFPVLFAITVHEWAHGYVASKLGDNTAKMLGRLSLNPIKHIDPIGTILVPSLLFFSSGFLFGWAKAVPININSLKNGEKSFALVALAGPSANIIMAILWAILHLLGKNMDVTYLIFAGYAGVQINIVLAVLNLLPIPPLDGARVIMPFLSNRMKYYASRIEPYGFILLIILLLSGILWQVLYPIVGALSSSLLTL